MNQKKQDVNIIEKALFEAERCLYCYDAPCVKACPINLPIPNFIYMLKNRNFYGAFEVIRESHPFISVAGFVCPEEMLCQVECVRGKIDSPIKIRELHNLLTSEFENLKNFSLPPYKYEDVAIIGGGPASLSCTVYLRMLGYKPNLFVEKDIGGIPLFEISKQRLPKEIVKKDLDFIKNNFIYKIQYEKIKSLDRLLKEFKAIFIGVGLGGEIKLDIPGLEKEGVYYARDLLKRIKEGDKVQLKDRIGIIGGGNVAFDVAISLKSIFNEKEIFILYRRGVRDLRCYPEEFERAKKLGVNFYFQVSPKEVLGNKKVEGLKVVQTKLIETKEERREFEEIKGSEFVIPIENLIVAIGQKLEEGIFPEIEKKDGLIKIDENFMTNIKGVFAGGDCVNGGKTITQATSEGKKASYKIHEYLRRRENV